LISPVINIAAGINRPTTISAKKPRKIQTIITSSPAGAFAAANAVAGDMVPISIVNFFDILLSDFLVFKKHQLCQKEICG